MVGSLLIARSTTDGSLNIYKTNPSDQIGYMTSDPQPVKYPLPECADQPYTTGEVYSTDSIVTIENCPQQILTIQSSIKFSMDTSSQSSWFNFDMTRYLPQLVFVGALIVTGIY